VQQQRKLFCQLKLNSNNKNTQFNLAFFFRCFLLFIVYLKASASFSKQTNLSCYLVFLLFQLYLNYAIIATTKKD